MKWVKEQTQMLLAGSFWFPLSSSHINRMPRFFNDSPGTITHSIKCAHHQVGTQETAAFHLLWDRPELWICLYFPQIVLKLSELFYLKKKKKKWLRKDTHVGDQLPLRSRVSGIYFKLSGEVPSLTLLNKNGSCGERSNLSPSGWFLSGLDPKLTFVCSSKAPVSPPVS